MSNPFMPDRSGDCEGTRHIPIPAQGDTLISSGGTPTDFMMQPTAHDWNNDIQPLEWKQNAPPNIGATAELAAQGIFHDFMGTIDRVANFPSGPGDDDSGPGWE